MAEMKYISEVTLDLNAKSNTAIVYAKQCDVSRYVKVRFTDNKAPVTIPEGHKVTIRVLKPDGYSVMDDDACEIAQDRSYAVAKLSEQALAAPGLGTLDFVISSEADGTLLSSANCKLRIEERALSTSVQSSNELSTLTRAFLEIDSSRQAIAEAEDEINDLVEDLASVVQDAEDAKDAANTAANTANAAVADIRAESASYEKVEHKSGEIAVSKQTTTADNVLFPNSNAVRVFVYAVLRAYYTAEDVDDIVDTLETSIAQKANKTQVISPSDAASLYGYCLSVGFDANNVPVKIVNGNSLSAGNFSGTAKTIYVHKDVTSVDGGSFAGCPNLTDVYFAREEGSFRIDSGAIPQGVTAHYGTAGNTADLAIKAIAYIYTQLTTKADTASVTALSNTVSAISTALNSLSNRTLIDGFDIDEEYNDLILYSNGHAVGDPIPLGSGSGTGGLAFDSGYVEDGKLHLTLNDQDIEGFTPFDIPAGSGSGTAADSKVRITNGMQSARLTVLTTTEQFNLLWSWVSLDADTNQPTQGNGTAYWYVNNYRVATETNLTQAQHSFDIRPHLAGETNTVKLTVEDAYGTTKSFTWTITLSNVALSWNIADIAFHGSEPLTLRVTPSGAGSKDITVTVDGTSVYSQQGVTLNNRPITIQVPAQTHGAHVIEASMSMTIDGELIEVPTLEHTGVWIEDGNNTPIVAIFKDELAARQYENVEIKWIAYDPENAVSAVTQKVDNTVVSSLSVGRDVQIWTYRPTTLGDKELRITTVRGSVSKKIDVTVQSIGIDVSPITDGIIMDLNPSGHSNSEENRSNFGYSDSSGTNHPLTYSANFDWDNGGFQRDENGAVAFVVKRGTSVTFDRSLFLASDNTNGETGVTGTGKHLSMIFKTTNVTNYDTKIAHSYDSGMGIELYAHNALFGAGNNITCQYCENRQVEMCLNIDPTKSSMKFWLEGTPAKGTTFLTGSTKTQFVQGNPDAFVIGSSDCDIWVYRFKMYRVSLLDKEIMQNFIADAPNVDEMLARYERNDIYNSDGTISIEKLMVAAPALHIITIETGGFPGDKGSGGNTSCKIIHQIGNGVAEDQWYADNAFYTLQGTSSMNYRQCAGNLDINMKKTTMKVSSTDAILNGYAMSANSIPVKYFNLKANVASSEHCNNVCSAELFNAFNPLVSKAKSVNSKCRDSVEGHPCAVFIKNTSNRPLLLGVNGARTLAPDETILYFAGDMNNSKKNTEVFGQTSQWDDENHQQCCIEFRENTYTRCTFKTSDFENEGWKEDGTDLPSHFEFRYPDGEGTQAMKDRFIEMHHWVNSTDPEQATNETLDVSDRFDIHVRDTAAYRRAKFKREVGDYFNLDNLLYYYLFTEFFLGVDQRAKNMFLSYEPDENDVWRWNLSKYYDGDTILGIDNKGQFRWGEAYSIEDTDGYTDEEDGNTHPYFNAAESVLFCNVRDCFQNELAVAYSVYENRKLFDAETLIEFFDEYQRQRPEALVIEDYAGKYDAPIENAGNTSWMENMEHGEKRPQREQFITYRELFISSKYVSAKAKSDLITYQAMPGANFSSALELTPYSDMYVGFLRDNTPAGSRRMTKGETAIVQCLDGNGDPFVLSAGEVNVQLFNGRNLMHVGGAANLYPGQVNITNGEKLRDLLLGGETYSSSNLKSLALNPADKPNVPLLRVIDLRGQSGISGALNLTRCNLLEEVMIAGTGTTDVYLPQSKILRKAILGTNVRTLHARNLPNLTSANFSCAGNSLTTILVEDSPGVPSDTLVANAPNLIRGRITNVNWSFADADVLTRLATLKGIDAEGNPIEEAGSFFLSGYAHINKITEDEIRTLIAAFPYLTFDYDQIVETYTVTFVNDDGTTLYTETVRAGNNAVNPVASGAIQTPTKTPTVDYQYTFTGWNGSLENINANTTLTATYNRSTRIFVVRYYDGSTLLETHNVETHGSCDYEGNDLSGPAGTIWMGFDNAAVNVVSDMDIHAQYITPTLPSSVPVSYDYLFSDNPNDNSAYTLAEFYGIIKANRCKDFFSKGDKVKILVSTNKFADTEIILRVEHFSHYKLADNSGNFAPVSFGMLGIMNATRQMNSGNTNVGGWRDCAMRNWLNNTAFPELPRHWKTMIAKVIVLSSQGNTSANIISSEDWLYLRSMAEVGFRTAENPYMYEVDSEAEDLKCSLFTDNNSRIKKYYNGTGSADNWWLRSPWSSNTTNFAIVTSNGYEYSNVASDSYGVSFGFSLA